MSYPVGYRAVACFLALTLAVAGGARWACGGQERSRRDQTHPGLKKYKGRVIAPVMGYEGAAWLERRDREATEQPDKVIESLNIPAGSTVADIGAGTGYFSLRIARHIGPEGRVLATDVQRQMIQLLGENMKRAGVTNIERILCTPRDTKLPPNEVDLALMVDVYHELSDPEGTVAQIRRALKPDGRLVLVEYRAEDPTVPIKPEHKMTLRQVIYEIEPMGFRLHEVLEFLVHQHVIVFKKEDVRGEEPVVDPSRLPMVRIPGGTRPAAEEFERAGFRPLFDGKSTAGWQGAADAWRVRNGILVGDRRDNSSGPAYLHTEVAFGSFELDLEWRLADFRGNSGVLFRSKTQSDGSLTGPQAEIAPGRHAGILQESGNDWIEPPSAMANFLIRPGEWNRYTIRCDGNRTQLAVNGIPVSEVELPEADSGGVIGLEHSSGQIEYRGIWIKSLD